MRCYALKFTHWGEGVSYLRGYVSQNLELGYSPGLGYSFVLDVLYVKLMTKDEADEMYEDGWSDDYVVEVVSVERRSDDVVRSKSVQDVPQV